MEHGVAVVCAKSHKHGVTSAGLLVHDKYAIFLVTFLQKMNALHVTNGWPPSLAIVVKGLRDIIGILADPGP